MSGSYFLYDYILGKCGHFLGKKQLFFRADMARLGKYHMGGYGWIGVHRVRKKEQRLATRYILV